MAGLAWGRKNETVRVWAVVLLGLAVARLFALDAFDAGMKGVMFPVGSQEVTWWLVLAWAGVLAAHGMAWLLGGDSVAEETRPWGRGLSVAGTAMFGVAARWPGTGWG